MKETPPTARSEWMKIGYISMFFDSHTHIRYIRSSQKIPSKILQPFTTISGFKRLKNAIELFCYLIFIRTHFKYIWCVSECTFKSLLICVSMAVCAHRLVLFVFVWSSLGPTQPRNTNRQIKAWKNLCSTLQLEFGIKCRRLKRFQEMKTNLLCCWVKCFLHFLSRSPFFFDWLFRFYCECPFFILFQWYSVDVCFFFILKPFQSMLIYKMYRVRGRRIRRDENKRKKTAPPPTTPSKSKRNRNEGNEFAMVGDYTCHRK